MVRTLLLLPLLALLGACSIMPDSNRRTSGGARPSEPAQIPSAELRQCLTRLGSAQANFTPVPDRYYGAGCATLGTVRLAALRSDNASLSLSNLGPVTCPLASTFADWARYGVDRAARVVLGSPLVQIETFGSYSCRNVAGSGRRSAHATANAIDVSAFLLADGRRISVKNGWDNGNAREREFLRIVHESACKRFGTVLGPEYNSAHEDHFHLEHGDGSYCH